jgi:hypothetical protein
MGDTVIVIAGLAGCGCEGVAGGLARGLAIAGFNSRWGGGPSILPGLIEGTQLAGLNPDPRLTTAMPNENGAKKDPKNSCQDRKPSQPRNTRNTRKILIFRVFRVVRGLEKFLG